MLTGRAALQTAIHHLWDPSTTRCAGNCRVRTSAPACFVHVELMCEILAIVHFFRARARCPHCSASCECWGTCALDVFVLRWRGRCSCALAWLVQNAQPRRILAPHHACQYRVCNTRAALSRGQRTPTVMTEKHAPSWRCFSSMRKGSNARCLAIASHSVCALSHGTEWFLRHPPPHLPLLVVPVVWAAETATAGAVAVMLPVVLSVTMAVATPAPIPAKSSATKTMAMAVPAAVVVVVVVVVAAAAVVALAAQVWQGCQPQGCLQPPPRLPPPTQAAAISSTSSAP